MTENGIPANLNITMVIGKGKVLELQVTERDGTFRDMSYYTYRGEVEGVDGERKEVSGWVDGDSPDVVMVEIPALKEGRYRWYLNATAEDGIECSLISGVLGVYWPEVRAGEGVDSPNRRVVVRFPDSTDSGIARWEETAWLEVAVGEAKDAAGEAAGAAEVAERAKETVLEANSEALGILREAQEFIDSFNKAVRAAITIGVNKNWWIGGVDTGIRAEGADGITPHIGEDGYWYAGAVSLDVKAQGENGLTPYIGANGNWCIGAIDTGVEARGRNGVDGTAVRRILVQAFADIPWVGDTCNGGFYYYVPSGEEYEVYAWLEPEGWVKVGLANDIATKEIHGLVKLGTDALVDGAPVGLNADGGLAVPTASASVAGSGKLGTDATVVGAPVGLNASKAYTVGGASVDGYGTVKLSSSATLTNGGLVGIDANGRLAVDWATDSQAGVIKVGRIGVTENEAPFAVTVVRTTANTLAFNCLTSGALQSRLGSSFYEAMDWVGDDIEPSETYVGLLTCEQFSQDSSEGLVLLDATNSRSGGVYVTSDYLDERDNAVLAAKTVLAQRSELYDEIVATYRRIDESYSQSEVADLLSTTLEVYYTANDVDERVASVADNVYTKEQSDARYVQQSEGSIKKLATMYKSEFDQLITRDSDTIYFVKRDV